MFQFVRARVATELLSLSDSTMKRYRTEGKWVEGIHWVKFSNRCIRYNLELIQDWVHNRDNPKAHAKAIAAYQANLLSSQRQAQPHPEPEH
jgi:tRNA(His) 5'-end guanylyltransferase